MGPILLALLMASQTGPAIPRVAVPRPEKPKLICRESEEETGSHIRTGRTCKTEEEWQRADDEKGRKPASMRVTEGQPDQLTPQRPP